MIEFIQRASKKIDTYEQHVHTLIGNFNPASDEFREAKRRIEEVHQKRFENEMAQLRKAIRAPVYMGMVGRYSHGKSALVNAIFGIPEEGRLPEGEGIMTSKITRVAFDAELASAKAELVHRNGETEPIDVHTLQEMARSKQGMETVDYLSLRLPAVERFSQLFAQNRVAIIDMPGIGGPYFRDTELTRRYLSEMDFLAIVIKITEIDKAGRVLEPLLANLHIRSCICVFTFYDEASSFPLFSGLDDEEIQEEAKKLAQQNMPSISRWIGTRSIFVSSKTGLNIPQLREVILNLFQEVRMAIEASERKVPEVFHHKVKAVADAVERSITSSERFYGDVERELATCSPSIRSDASSEMKRMMREIEREKKRADQEMRREVRDGIQEVRDLVERILRPAEEATNFSTLSSYLQEMQSELDVAVDRVTARMARTFDGVIKPVVKRSALERLDAELKLFAEREEELKGRIEEEIERFRPVFDIEKFTSFQSLSNEVLKSEVKAGTTRVIGHLGSKGNFIGRFMSYISHVFGIRSKQEIFEQEKRRILKEARHKLADATKHLETMILERLGNNTHELTKVIERVIADEIDEVRQDRKRAEQLLKGLRKAHGGFACEMRAIADELKVNLASTT